MSSLAERISADMKEIPTLEKIVLQIRLGKLDPQIVCRILLQRIQKYDPKLRAYVRLNPEAPKLAERRNYHEHRSPLLPLVHLPISVKDLIDTKGIATSYGAESVFGNHVPRADAKVVTKIKQSGGFVLGKTRTHQFALGLETPPTRNPWDAARIPGGSSGGSAAAVTAGLALCALGTDTGGSVRIPAAMCGVVGLKPTYGRISNEGVFPTAPSMDHVGPMCRYASDLPMLLSAMGYKVRAKRWKRGTRIAVVRSFLEQAETGVRSAVKKCINVLLSEALVEVEEIDELPMFDEVCKATEAIDTYEVARVHKRRFLENPRMYGRTARGLIKAGLEVKPRELEAALLVKRRAQREYMSLTRRFPVLIYPTIPCIAPRPEEISSYSASDFLPLVRPLEVFNLLGYPALSIPCGFVDGLPVGAHLVSYRGMDELAIALAVEYQQVTRWHTAVPDAFGEK